MQLRSQLLGLPAALILLITAHTPVGHGREQSPAPWLNGRSPEDSSWLEKHRRRALSSDEQANYNNSLVGVIKMSEDPGEKFFPEYWVFDNGSRQTPRLEVVLSPPLRSRDEEEELNLLSNASTPISYRPPFALHVADENIHSDLRSRERILGRGAAAAALTALQKRDFTCPSGTSDCSSVGAPNACCATGETCFSITDTGLGSVGCCPNGANCGGTISNCGSVNSPCGVGGQNYEYGGCCIPNYVCAGVGCVINPTLVVTVVVTQTFTASQSTVQTSTVLSTITPSVSTGTNTALQTTLVCSSSMHACPVNLGGGCCTSGFACASGSSCIPPSGFTFPSVSTTTSAAGIAPVRPTTADSSSSASAPFDSGSCPTGFYACEAFYRGGCCRTGRDCQTTSCPPTSSTTIVSGTATIVVPVDGAATLATPSGECATGWSSCAASVGGNCCPGGWECGTASCSSISPSQTNVLQKASPNAGHFSIDGGSSVLVLAVAVGFLNMYILV